MAFCFGKPIQIGAHVAEDSRSLALEYLTFLGVDPLRHVRLAAAAGFDAVGIRVSPADPADVVPDLRVHTPAFRELKHALDDSGLSVLDVEVVAIGSATKESDYSPALEIGNALGARYINVVANDPDIGRLTDNLSHLAERAEAFGLVPALEPMAWKTVSDLATAARIAEQSGVVVQIDSLHLFRCGNTPDDVSRVRPELLSYLQLSDAPRVPSNPEPAELQAEGRYSRLLPGEGELDLTGLIASLPSDILIAAEVPSLARRDLMDDDAYASLVYRATRNMVNAQ